LCCRIPPIKYLGVSPPISFSPIIHSKSLSLLPTFRALNRTPPFNRDSNSKGVLSRLSLPFLAKTLPRLPGFHDSAGLGVSLFPFKASIIAGNPITVFPVFPDYLRGVGLFFSSPVMKAVFPHEFSDPLSGMRLHYIVGLLFFLFLKASITVISLSYIDDLVWKAFKTFSFFPFTQVIASLRLDPPGDLLVRFSSF